LVSSSVFSMSAAGIWDRSTVFEAACLIVISALAMESAVGRHYSFQIPLKVPFRNPNIFPTPYFNTIWFVIVRIKYVWPMERFMALFCPSDLRILTVQKRFI
jgi:hypothetical protein